MTREYYGKMSDIELKRKWYELKEMITKISERKPHYEIDHINERYMWVEDEIYRRNLL